MKTSRQDWTTTTTRPTGVLVGDDGTRHSRRVVELAVDEAGRLGLPLTVLVVAHPVADPDRSMTAQRRDERAAVEEAGRLLDATLARARARCPDRSVTGLLMVDPDETDLTDRLAECALVVVGSRGAAGHRVFSLGTTSRHLLRSAPCPVLVVPVDGAAAPVWRSGLVVVGLDDGPLGPLVVREAAAAASPARHVQVLHSYRRRQGETAEVALARARAICDEQVRRADPQVRITRVLTSEPAAAALVRQASGGASLLVIGSRGPLALAGLTHDSVSRAVLEVMPCPVLVVPRSTQHRPAAVASRAQLAGK